MCGCYDVSSILNMKPYNLRSKKRQILNCYQQEGKIPSHYNPVVVLKRVPDVDSITHRFHVTKDNEIIVRVNNNYSKGFYLKIFLACFFIPIFLLFLYYCPDAQQYFKNIISTFKLKNKSQLVAKDTCDIKDLVPSALYTLITEEEGDREEEEEIPMSFIQQQCLIPEDGTKLDDDLFTNANEIFEREYLTDYALESKGARVVTIFDTKPYGFLTLNIWGFDFGSSLGDFCQRYFYSIAPYRILTPWSKPGECWAFKGSYGKIKIELWDQIRISAISIDHVRNENFSVGDSASAPRMFSVTASESENSSGMLLGMYEYRITGPSVQTFPIPLGLMKNPCRFVEITITSNHGNKDYTCLYRVRVHGRK